MHFEDVIKGRRSIRRYRDKDIPRSLVGEILDLAKHTPSSGNLQNWKVIVVKDSEMRQQLAQASMEQYWMVEAPIHLVICNDYDKVKDHYPVLGKMYSIQNCAAFAYNITLSAHTFGLGSCWIGAFDNEKVQRLLSIPDNIDPEIIITLGYSEDSKSPQLRDEVKYITYQEKWGAKFKVPKSELEQIESGIKKEVSKFKKKLKTIKKRK
ncbi:nitroreductase [archaeon]|mgnify:CR=1 FL=1|nr:nitroreductase [archaeon]|tara:strand:- start:304 stop:930 length:627 start_codon:yes stop_codon:yes gene_type:complete